MTVVLNSLTCVAPASFSIGDNCYSLYLTTDDYWLLHLPGVDCGLMYLTRDDKMNSVFDQRWQMAPVSDQRWQMTPISTRNDEGRLYLRRTTTEKCVADQYDCCTIWPPDGMTGWCGVNERLMPDPQWGSLCCHQDWKWRENCHFISPVSNLL
jgi:hypothetical protein